MFHRHSKKAKPTQAKPLKDLMAVVTPTQLLSEGRRPELLEKIKESSTFDKSKHDQLCLSLIHNLINHCQSLPETFNSYYASPGGFLDHALNRTEASLHLFHQYVLQEGHDLSEEQKLWLYALLSAGILQGIGKLQIDYRVDLFDVNGQKLKQWNPLLESLASVATYYHYEFQPEHEDNLRRRLNLLLARLLMPASGFFWIASNPEVLAVWLALLNEDWQSAGTLGAILIRADAIAIQRDFSERMIKMTAPRTTRRITTFVDTTPESLAEKERLIGLEFIQWLIKQFETGRIMINKAPLFMVPGGMLMSVDMFKWFIREHPEYKNWQAAQNGFLSLGMHQVNADGSVLSRFEQSTTQQMVSGVVFTDYGVALPENVRVHHLSTGKVESMSATEVMNTAQLNSYFTRHSSLPTPSRLSHLNAAGKWQPSEAASASVQQGKKFSG